MMKRLALTLSVLAIVALLSTGCVLHGGGWIASRVDPEQKANIGFQAKMMDCSFAPGQGWWEIEKGQIEYQDHGMGLRIHGKITGPRGFCVIPEEWIEGYVEFEWRHQGPPPPGVPETGYGDAYFVDNGEPGNADPGDYVSICLWGPGFGYCNNGRLGGGNLQDH
jgi:hypothetical protein